VRRTFNPEFLNRIDETIIFRSLEREDMVKIVDILFKEVQNRLSDRDLELVLTDQARELIVAKGYDPSFGARPLRRVIRQSIEDPLSEEILAGKFHPGDRVVIDRKEDGLEFVKGSSHEPPETIGTAPLTGQESPEQA
jgi:ATP-dependent Clp protease ATP-binding subunit ClpA